MTWQRHKGTNTLPPRWTSGRWTIYRTVSRTRVAWELWDTQAKEWHRNYHTLFAAKQYAARYDNATTAP